VTTVLSIALWAACLVAVPAAAYWLGRRSKVDRAVDARLDRELYRPRVNPQKAEDRGSEG